MPGDAWGRGRDPLPPRALGLSVGLGLGAFVIAFFGALLLGRGLTGDALGALTVPLALAGAAAVGVGVTFSVAGAVDAPYRLAQARRAMIVVTPLAVLVAMFAYAAEPAAPLRTPFGIGPSAEPRSPIAVTPPVRTVAVPPVHTAVVPPAGQPGTAAAGSRRSPLIGPVAGPRAPGAHPARHAVHTPRALAAHPTVDRPRAPGGTVTYALDTGSTGRCWRPGPGRGSNPHRLPTCAAPAHHR